MKRLAFVLLAACGSSGGKKAAPDAGAVAVSATTVGPVTAPGVERLGGPVLVQVDDTRFIVATEALVDLGVEAPGYDAAMTTRGARLGHVAPGTIAARLGLADGDVIVQLDGAPVRRLSELQDAWLVLRRDGALTVGIEHGPQRLERRIFLAERLDDAHVFAEPPATDDPVDVALLAALRTGVHPGDPGELDPQVLATLATDGMLTLTTHVRFRPPEGIELVPGSPLAALGLTRFDVIKTVGAMDTSSTEALSRELGAQHGELSLMIARVRDPVLLKFKIVPGLIDQAALDAALAAWKTREAEVAAEAARLASARDALDAAAAADWAGKITRIDDTHYEVDRQLFVDLLSTPGTTRGARITPSIKNGKPNGIKLYAIRPSSVFAHLGLVNGDTLETVNGLPIDSLDPAQLAAVTRNMRKAKTVEFALTRRGKPVTVEYKLR